VKSSLVADALLPSGVRVNSSPKSLSRGWCFDFVSCSPLVANALLPSGVRQQSLSRAGALTFRICSPLVANALLPSGVRQQSLSRAGALTFRICAPRGCRVGRERGLLLNQRCDHVGKAKARQGRDQTP
jgi:hypothetical protein